MSTLGSVSALLDDTQGEKGTTRNLDLSEVLGKPEGTIIFSFQLPDAKRMWAKNKDAAQIRKANPLLTSDLCQFLATIAIAHVAPLPGPNEPPVGMMYLEFVNKSDTAKGYRFWNALESGFVGLFPELYPLTKEGDPVEEAKKSSTVTPSTSDTSTSV